MAASQTTSPIASVSYTSATTVCRVARIEGLNLFYREAGPKDAPAIVLLHGYPSSSRMWEKLIPLLADRYHLVAPDYPGFGLSDAPAPDRYRYTFDHLAQTTAALLSKIGIIRYTLFMQDYGGPIGFRIAMAAPEKVQAMIIQNANAYQEGLGPKWAGIAQYWANPAQHAQQVDAFVSFESTKARHLGTSPNPERYDPDVWNDEFAMLSRPGQRAVQAALLYDYQTNVASYPHWQAWLRQHHPRVLVLWGRYDPSFIVPARKATSGTYQTRNFISSMPVISRWMKRPMRLPGSLVASWQMSQALSNSMSIPIPLNRNTFMPLVRIVLLKGRTPAELRVIADAVHEALVEVFEVPLADRFQIIEQREANEIIYSPDYQGIERSDQLVIIQILAADSRDTAAKQALYSAVTDRLSAAAGLRREDIQIILAPNQRADWSFGNGVASYPPITGDV